MAKSALTPAATMATGTPYVQSPQIIHAAPQNVPLAAKDLKIFIVSETLTPEDELIKRYHVTFQKQPGQTIWAFLRAKFDWLNEENCHLQFTVLQKHLPQIPEHPNVLTRDSFVDYNVYLSCSLVGNLNVFSQVTFIAKSYIAGIPVRTTLALIEADPTEAIECNFNYQTSKEISPWISGICKVDVVVRAKKVGQTNLSLTKQMKSFREENEHFDVKISCDGEEFQCHKMLLAVRSQVFKAMFEAEGVIENENGVIEIADVSAETMKIFLRFLYEGHVDNSEVSPELLYVAHKYVVKNLEDFCVSVMRKSINMENLIDTMKIAYLLDKQSLLRMAFRTFVQPKVLLALTEEWAKFTLDFPGVVKELQSFYQSD